jgi:hypothetical protein
MTRENLTHTPFDDAPNVKSIRYRLAPIDVGFSLRAEGMPVLIDSADDPLRVSYDAEHGGRRVVEGPHDDVVAWLRDQGYEVQETE